MKNFIHRVVTESFAILEGRLPPDGRDPEYGIPEQKKFPLWNESHVRSAIKFFNYAEPRYRKKLAGMIKSRMRQYGISFDTVGEDNDLRKYL